MPISTVHSAETGGRAGKPRQYVTYQNAQVLESTVEQQLPPGNSQLMSVLVGKDADFLSNNQFC